MALRIGGYRRNQLSMIPYFQKQLVTAQDLQASPAKPEFRITAPVRYLIAASAPLA
jgi:hypothetical protein